jgi:NADP-dependent 3-hydroxy acid dehydrogenase YdfG
MGLLNGISAVLPVMHQQGYGHIIATGSMAGYNIYPNSAVYCASKFAERAIMESLRQEELPNHIKTTYLAPGMVETELLASVGDKQRAEEIADAWHETDHALTADDVASLVVYMISAPDVVAINEVQIRPRAER